MKQRMRIGGVLLAVATVGALAAGCGGKNTPSSSTGASAAPSGRAEFQAYAACLNQHGVKISFPTARPDRGGSPRPRPSGIRPSGVRPSGFRGGGFGGFFGNNGQPPAGVDAATWAAAQKACASLAPQRRFANNTALTAYRNCLASHGVTMSAGPGALSTADPKVAAAMKICAPLRPTRGPRPTVSPSPTG